MDCVNTNISARVVSCRGRYVLHVIIGHRFMEDNVGEDAVTVRLPRKSGEDVELTLGRERFHAPELLFSVSHSRI